LCAEPVQRHVARYERVAVEMARNVLVARRVHGSPRRRGEVAGGSTVAVCKIDGAGGPLKQYQRQQQREGKAKTAPQRKGLGREINRAIRIEAGRGLLRSA